MSQRGKGHGSLRVRLLGSLALSRGAEPIALPASRKVRGLLAYLALAARPVGRSHLCDLLWDAPSDPRGELRWCLSRIRAAIDEPGRPRVLTEGDTIALDLGDCACDALELGAALREGVGTVSSERQQALVALFHGDFLEGLEIEDSPAFGGWLGAQRRQFRGFHAALLERLSTHLPPAEAIVYQERWLQLAPFDRCAHEAVLASLAQGGRIREGEEHLIATAARFESEGLDSAPLREVWRQARAGDRVIASADRVIPSASVIPSAARDLLPPARRGSIAVMPFSDDSSAPSARGGVADALAHDVTTRLAKLRSLFVIAQGSAFALAERRIGADAAGRMLNVDYVLSGAVRRRGARLVVTVDLTETRTARVVWSEVFDHRPDDAFEVLEAIGNRIVASIASEIETLERNRAILKPPSSLDAWEAHHRGLWHMYRFTREDNDQARHFFETAVKLDPTFARAHAGLSFTHFQNAFQGWAPRGAQADRAFEAAGQSLMVDTLDPAAHWAMGRALWLRGGHDDAVAELRHAIDLSPNFALAHYSLAFVEAQAGDASAAVTLADASRALSPFDPLLFGMLGSRAIALVRLGQFEEAARWAVRAAARPNAHPHIFAIAAYSLALAGSLDEARSHASAVRRARPGYGIKDFLGTFHLDDNGASLFNQGAARLGLN